MSQLVESQYAKPAVKHPGVLTPRQIEIVKYIAIGKSSCEVAAILGISTKTVETHRAALMQRLDLHSVVELVHWALASRVVACLYDEGWRP